MAKRKGDIIRTYSCKYGHSLPDTSQENWKFIINNFTDGVRNKKILDVGCGSGQLITELSKLSNYSIGVETSDSFKKHLHDSNKCNFVKADCHQFPFRSGVFDLLISIATLEHVMDYEAALIEMKRVLKKGGFAFFLLGPTPIWKYFDFKAHREITVKNPEISTVLNLLKDGEYKKVGTYNIKYRLTMMSDYKIHSDNKLIEKLLKNYAIKYVIIAFFFILERINLEQNITIVYKKKQ